MVIHYFCDLDEATGKPVTGMAVSELPDGSVVTSPDYPYEITEEMYNSLHLARYEGGKWSLDAPGTPPPAEPETDAQKIARLEAQKDELSAQLTQLNEDLSGFIDFYFTTNPEQA